MCGIVGCIGHQSAQKLIMKGLERLEYRGYDSAGMFYFTKEDSKLVKQTGRIQQLKEKVDFSKVGHTGIGHTRWATHGPATVENAHPHQSSSKRWTLVHNGVIENYNELREEYLKEYSFYSQTDTEVLVQLVEYFAITDHLSTKEAFRKVLQVAKGSYALALLDKEHPEEMFAAKHKSPLLIGVGKDFHVVCSDAMATIDQTDEYIEIKDQELVTLTSKTVQIETIQGESVSRLSYKAEIDATDIQKGTYPHYMLKEMDEQPAVIRRILQKYTNEEGELTISKELLKSLLDAERVYIIACGTSYHAGWVGKRLLEDLAKVPTEVHLASEFAYYQPLVVQKPFFIFLTQSGETADSRQALVEVNRLHYPSLTITNVKSSTMSREATHTLLLHAGPEIAVASTKAYIAQLSVLAILADILKREKGLNGSFDMKEELSRSASIVESILDKKLDIKEQISTFLENTRNAFYIGRQLDYYVSMEAALKLKEISYIQTESFAAGELKHGTIALIEEGTPVIALISDSKFAAHTRGNCEEVRARGAKVFTIAMEEVANPNDQFIIPNCESLISPLVMVVVTQLIAYYASLERGLDVDKPRNLAKSVTVE